jgi:signal transduction histidine kinase
MRKLLDRLGSPDAISWVNFAVIFVLQMAGSTISSLVDFSGRALEFYSIRVFVLLCLIPVFLLGRLTLNRFAKTRPKPLITLTTFVVAMVISSFLFDYLLILFEFTDIPQGFQRLTSVTFGFLSTSILISLLVTYAREFTRDNQKLMTSAKNLLETRSQAGEKIARRQAELIESIKAQINMALSGVKGQNLDEDAIQMRTLIDDVVRPISYDLARNVKADAADIELEIEPKIDWRKVSSHALRSNPFHTFATPLALSITITPFLLTNFQLAGALAVLSFVVVFSLTTLLAGLVWRKTPASWPGLLRGILFSSANAVIAISVMPVITLTSGFNLFEPVRIIAWIVLCNLTAWTVALVAGALDLLKATNNALNEAVDDLKREVISLNGSYRQLQQGISRVLHGPVQEAITAALLKLQSPGETQNHSALAEDLRLRISKSLEVLDAPTLEVTDVSKSLADLKELWSDAVEINVTLSTQDSELLRTQPWASKVITELAREACSNAIRHGNATRILIDIQASSSTESVSLRVENNGQALPEQPRYGLGSQLFDEVCLEWSISRTKGGVLVQARVPLVSTDLKAD